MRGDMSVADNHMKTGSTDLVIRKVQFKTMMRYHYAPVRMVTIRKTDNTKY